MYEEDLQPLQEPSKTTLQCCISSNNGGQTSVNCSSQASSEGHTYLHLLEFVEKPIILQIWSKNNQHLLGEIFYLQGQLPLTDHCIPSNQVAGQMDIINLSLLKVCS